jgi:hypothetical protein
MALIDISKIAVRKQTIQDKSNPTTTKDIDLTEMSTLPELYQGMAGRFWRVLEELISFALGEIKEFNKEHEASKMLYSIGCDEDVITTQLLSYALPKVSVNAMIRTSGVLLDNILRTDLHNLIGYPDGWDENVIRDAFFEKDYDLAYVERVKYDILRKFESSNEFDEYVSDFNNIVCASVREKANQLFNQKLNLNDGDNLFAFNLESVKSGQVEVSNISKMIAPHWHSDAATQYNYTIQTILHVISDIRFRTTDLQSFRTELLDFIDDDAFLISSNLPLVDSLNRENKSSVAVFLRQFAQNVTEEEFNGIKNLNYKVSKDWLGDWESYSENPLEYMCLFFKPENRSSFIRSNSSYKQGEYESPTDGSSAPHLSFKPIDMIASFSNIIRDDLISEMGVSVLSVFRRGDGSFRELSVSVEGGETLLRVNPKYPFIAKHAIAPSLEINTGTSGVYAFYSNKVSYKAKFRLMNSSYI